MTVAVADTTSLKWQAGNWQADHLRSNGVPDDRRRSPFCQPRLLVAIDAKVDAFELLAAGTIRDAEVVILRSNRDGIEQITETLQQYPQISSLHLVAHGAPGSISLGDRQLSLETIDSYADQLQAWFASRLPSAPRSLQIYACNVAAGDRGAAFMQRLHQLTGATIAASTQTVGQSEQGGTWRLNAFTPINRAKAGGLPFLPETLAAYPATLALRSIGSADTWVALGITVVDGYAYVADEVEGVKVFDVRNPASPQLTDSETLPSGQVNDDNGAFGVAVSGNFLYVAHGLEGLRIFEITEVNSQRQLTPVGSSSTVIQGIEDSEAYSVAIAGNFAFVAAHQAGLQVFNISNPAAPERVARLADIDQAFGIAVAGNYAYIASGTNGLRVVDISSPNNPRLVRTVADPGFATGVAIVGDFAYVTSRTFGAPGTDGLYIININNPESASVVSRYDTAGEAIGVSVFGSYAYVADGETGIEIVDIRDRQNPQFAAEVDTDGRAYGVTVVGNQVFVADGRQGIKIFGSDFAIVSATTPNGAYNAGDSIDITVTFDEAVTVTGQPQLRLETGAIDRLAIYDPGRSSGRTLSFRYVVQAGDNSADLDIASNAALELNGGTIRYTASGLDAFLTLPLPGARGSLSASRNIVVDTIAPDAPVEVPLLAATSDTGVLDSDRLTNDRTLTFTGTGTVGDRVEIYADLDSNLVGSATVDADGNWTVTTAALAEGDRVIWSTFRDLAGNQSDRSPEVEVTIDLTSPPPPAAPDLVADSDTGRSATDNITNDTTPTFSGTGGTVGDTVKLYTTDSGGNRVEIGSSTIDSSGWTVTATSELAEQIHLITATFTDRAGNESSPSPSLNLDLRTAAPATPTVAPSLSVISDRGISETDGITNDSTPTFSGTGTANSTIQVLAGDSVLGLATANAQGRWIFTPTAPLADGAYSISFKAIDLAGNISAASPPLAIEIDTQAPIGKFARVRPNLRDSAVNAIDLEFDEAISDFDLSDLVLTRDGQALSLEGATLTTTDRKTWTIDNLANLTQSAGSYRLGIKPEQSSDRAGNLLSATPIETWTTAYLSKALPQIQFDSGKPGREINGRGLVLGGRDRDVLRGFGGRNAMWGRNGSDVLIGGSGNDFLRGGRRNDRLIGRGGNDTLRGNQANDLLLGSEGNDFLIGGLGNDVLVGGLGNDVLVGNAGRDTFAYTSLAEAGDRILDLNREDLIDLRGIFKADAFLGGTDLERFSEFVALKQVSGAVEVRVDRDGNGSGTTFTTLATIENATLSSVTASNFVIS